jgi:DNA-binding CsgD family transcriptional regulator
MARGLERAQHALRFRWPARLRKLLGTMPDAALAPRAGVHAKTVLRERQRSGIPPYRKKPTAIEWTERMLALLGTASDQAVADELGLSPATVSKTRRRLGLPAFQPSSSRAASFPWTKWAVAQLGTASDAEVAKRLGLSRTTVMLKRQELDIPTHKPALKPITWTAEMIALLGKVTDTEVARRFGIHQVSVLRKREELSIPPKQHGKPVARTRTLRSILRLPNRELWTRYAVSPTVAWALRRKLGIATPDDDRKVVWTKRALVRLGKEPDLSIAKDMGISHSAVNRKRRALGIQSRLPMHRWTEAECSLLGRLTDREIADRLGLSQRNVLWKRLSLGLPPPRRQKHS